jgi:hypothetical protein
MKKALFLLMIGFAFALHSQAQTTTFSHTATNPTGAVVNTGIDTMTVAFPGNFSAIGIQPVVSKVSGTVAGTSILYGSINGTTYVATGDTLTNTNVTTNTKVIKLTFPVYRTYRLITAGSGTMSATTGATITGIKAY